jgi:hypothetical protein
MAAFVGFIGLVWIIGVVVAFWVVYFRNGLGSVKRAHRVDWREYLLSNIGFWFTNVLAWPVGLTMWFSQGQPPKSLAAVEVDGREARSFVSTADYDVSDGIARTAAASPQR